MKLTSRMSVVLGLAAILLPAHVHAQATDPAPESGGDADVAPWKFRARHTVYGYVTQQDPTDSSYNPGNLLARLPRTLVDFEWREDWRAALSACDAQTDLRFIARKTVKGGPGIAPDWFTDAYLRTGAVACRFGAGFEIRAGREVLQWGNATFRSPSNPFFIDTGKTHPIRELLGKDMVQLVWRNSSGWAASAVRTLGVGSRDDVPRPYRPVSALRVDHVGQARSAGAIASVPDGGHWQLGGYVTQTVSDAWLVYADASVRRGSEGVFPLADPSAPGGWRFAATRENDSRLGGSALLGAAYTFESGWSLTGEALVNNVGYSAADRELARKATAAGAALFLSGSPLAGAGAGILGDALQSRMQVQDRHYLFLQLLRTEWKGKADVAMRWAHNFDDGGSTLQGSLTYFLGDRTQLIGVGAVNTGPKDAEFSRLLRYSVIVALRVTL